MPAAPKEKSTPTAREKGKAKARDREEGDGGKEPKQRKKPGRVPTSCAECRRLKLKCDRNVPCAKCVSRGCGSICPEGTLAPGKGNRLVLANTEELHARVDALSDRNRALEKALKEVYGSGEHPLLKGLELGDLTAGSSGGGARAGLGSTSESSHSSLMVPTPSPRASTSASASTNSPGSQSRSHPPPHPHSQSRSPAPTSARDASTSTAHPYAQQSWRPLPPKRSVDPEDAMDLDLDPDDADEKDDDDGKDADEGFLGEIDAKGTLFFLGASDSGASRSGTSAGVSGGGKRTYHYLGRSARPELLAQTTPLPPPRLDSNASASFSLAQVRSILPTREVALNLCDIYLAYGTSLYTCAMSRSRLEGVLWGVYRVVEYAANTPATHASLPSEILSETALLFAVFALGALLSPSAGPYTEEAKKYHAASCGVVDILRHHEGDETLVHALLHLSQFAELCSSLALPRAALATSSKSILSEPPMGPDAAWALVGQAVRIAQHLGMHTTWPGMEEDDRRNRENLWWGLFVSDTWASFNLGRPPAISRAYVDCEVPPNRALPSHVDLGAGDSESIFHSWYLHFTILLHDVLPCLVASPKSSASGYAEVLEHDRRIRDFYVPRAWCMPSEVSTPARTDKAHPAPWPPMDHADHDEDDDDDDDDDNDDDDLEVGVDEVEDDMQEDTEPRERHSGRTSGRKRDEEEMYRWLVLSAKEIVLLRLHQPYFLSAVTASRSSSSKAERDNDGSFGVSAYLPSILAVYRSIRRLSRGLSRTWTAIPKFLARVPTAWSYGLSATVAAALLVARAPYSDLAPGALAELAALSSLFEVAAPLCLPAANMLSLLHDLHATAAQAHPREHYRGDARVNIISLAELERLNGQTTRLQCSPIALSGSYHRSLVESTPTSTSLSMPSHHQYRQKHLDYDYHEPHLRPRSRATSSTMSDFATDTHYNQPHTHMHPHNTRYIHPPQDTTASQGSRTQILSRGVLRKLHPVLTHDIRLFEEQGTLSNVPLTFHDSHVEPITVASNEKTPQRREPPQIGLTPLIPHEPAIVDSLPLTTSQKPQGLSYRDPTPPPREFDQRSYPPPSIPNYQPQQYHGQETSPNPPRFIVDPYMSPKPHTAPGSSSLQYIGEGHAREHAYTGSQPYSSTNTHAPNSAGYQESIYQGHGHEQHGYRYDDVDDEDMNNTITSGFYTSESRTRPGLVNASSMAGSDMHLSGTASASANSFITNISTTTTTTATMSTTANAGGFIPQPFVLGPLPNGFQSGFFPAGFSSGFYPSPIVLDPSWNSFVEQLGFKF